MLKLVSLFSFARDGNPREAKPRRSPRKLDVPITKEVTQSSGGGIMGFLVKVIMFILIVLVVLYIIGQSSDDATNQITGSD